MYCIYVHCGIIIQNDCHTILFTGELKPFDTFYALCAPWNLTKTTSTICVEDM